MNEKCKFNFWFDWGCLWNGNTVAFEKFDAGSKELRLEKMGLISTDLVSELDKLDDEHKTILDWSCPSDITPWNKKKALDFKRRTDTAFERLVKELGDDFELVYKHNTIYSENGIEYSLGCMLNEITEPVEIGRKIFDDNGNRLDKNGNICQFKFLYEFNENTENKIFQRSAKIKVKNANSVSFKLISCYANPPIMTFYVSLQIKDNFTGEFSNFGGSPECHSNVTGGGYAWHGLNGYSGSMSLCINRRFEIGEMSGIIEVNIK